MARFKNGVELVRLLDEIFSTRPLSEWAEIFDAEPDFFWSPVQTVEDLLCDEQFLAAGGLVQVPDEQGSQMMIATPADFEVESAKPRFRAPRPGEHTREVLEGLGYDESQIASLESAGAVRTEQAERETLGEATGLTPHAARPSCGAGASSGSALSW